MTMKKLLVLALLSIASISLNAQNQLGIGAIYGTEITQPGVAVKGAISLGEGFSFVPEVGAFLSNKRTVTNTLGFPDRLTTNLVTFNLDFKYHLQTDLGGTLVYALLGANFTEVKKRLDSESDPEIPETIDELGLRSSGIGANAGMGIMYPINQNLFIYTEAKYMYNDYSQAVFSLGVMTNL